MKRRQRILVVIGAVLVLAAVLAGIRGVRQVRETQHLLADGSVMELADVILTSTSLTMSHQTGNRWLRMVSPILPSSLKGRLGTGAGASFGFGVEEGTNLFFKTVVSNSRGKAPLSPSRLRVVDDAGNTYDACWGAHTGNFGTIILNGWQLRAFPKRGRELTLCFLDKGPDNEWTNVATFKIRNPAPADYPQWIPEMWPVTKTDQGLAVRLREFQSGGRLAGERGVGRAGLAPRKTRVVLEFSEGGQVSDQWRLQKLTLSDATGNQWSPWLSLQPGKMNWVTHGTAEFLGALWPGENAWRFKAEVVRTGGFASNDLWTVTLPLPETGTIANLTNRWEHENLAVALVGLGSPATDYTGEFQWVAKWWGDQKNKTWSLAIKLGAELEGRRFIVVGAVDQDGHKVEIADHPGMDNRLQAVFFRPRAETAAVRFRFSVVRSRFVEFLARPEFEMGDGR